MYIFLTTLSEVKLFECNLKWTKKTTSYTCFFVVFFFFFGSGGVFVLVKVLKGSRRLYCECGECVLTFACGLVVNTKRRIPALTEVLRTPVHLEM